MSEELLAVGDILCLDKKKFFVVVGGPRQNIAGTTYMCLFLMADGTFIWSTARRGQYANPWWTIERSGTNGSNTQEST